MDDMQFAKYSCDIREILENVNSEDLENLVRNVVKFAVENNHSKTNWTAHELFVDVLHEEVITELFDEE